MDLLALSEGLNDMQVLESRKLHGSNNLDSHKQFIFFRELLSVFQEPMFLLLAATALIYFIIGFYTDGMIMIGALVIIGLISIIQAGRSRNAMELLKVLSAPKAVVLRNNMQRSIPIEDIVVADIFIINEGEFIPADGLLIDSKDFSVNESLITGESVPVLKSAFQKDEVFRGCHVISGSAKVKVTQVGMATKIGQIGKSVAEVAITKTPLQKQIRRFMIGFVLFGLAAFGVIVISGLLKGEPLWTSLLRALTLSMSILPEELPVTFTSFLAIAAIHLSRKNKIIVKQPVHVETLGSTSVIAADKTGTLTKNEMTLVKLFDFQSKKTIDLNSQVDIPVPLLEYAMWSSETDAFDPMEQSIHHYYELFGDTSLRNKYRLVKEYALSGTPPAMTHIFENDKEEKVIAMKGATEKIIQLSSLGEADKKLMHDVIQDYGELGLRVLAVAKGSWKGRDWPESQESIQFEMLGLLAFQDLPKDNISDAISTFHAAGISVKMITGDYAVTALAIAKMVGIQQGERVVTGEEVMKMDIEQLKKAAKNNHVFARMFPEAKMKLVEAMIASGEVVAMTGDGVNDAPALKAAHIGIAMGRKGSEVARESASLILSDDNLANMTVAVAVGRQVYDNIKKAILYIISIHIPIILIVGMPLLLGWKFNTIFAPVHIVFFELLMGPACALVFQQIPPEKNLMKRKPRALSGRLFSKSDLLVNVMTGLFVAVVCLSVGYYALTRGCSEPYMRNLIFSTLFWSNLILIVAGSFSASPFAEWKATTGKSLILLLGVSIFLYLMILLLQPLRQLFLIDSVGWKHEILCIFISFIPIMTITLIKKMKWT